MVFDVVVVGHIIAALTCVLTGIVAIVSKKRPGRHPRCGTIYYEALVLVFATFTTMSVLHWPQDADLSILGAVASVGYVARSIRWRGWTIAHISGMGLSYVALLTAFYVDNGPHVPLWQLLPHLTYWLLPSAVGIPLIVRALRRYRGRRARRGCAYSSVS